MVNVRKVAPTDHVGNVRWLRCSCQAGNPEGEFTLHNRTKQGGTKGKKAADAGAKVSGSSMWRCAVCGKETGG
jgi:hypothetical protein